MKNLFQWIPGKTALCTVIFLGMCAGSISAQETPATQGHQIVVSATKTEREFLTVPSSVALVTEKEIKRNGYTSIADMLQDVPGVEIFDQSLAGAKRVKIRGEAGSRVLILVDGQKISEQKSMDGAALLIDPNNVERIEVIKGPASVLYGSEAIGGAINIITKKGGTAPLQGEISLGMDTSTDGYTAGAALSGSMDSFYYRLGATRSENQDRHTPDGTLEESNSDMFSANVLAGYRRDKLNMGMALERYTSAADSPPIEVNGSPFNLNLPDWSRNKARIFMDMDKVSALIAKIHGDAFMQRTEKDFEQGMLLSMGPMGRYSSAMDTHNDQKTYGINAQVDMILNMDHYIIAGYSWNYDTLDANSGMKFTYLGGRRLPPPPMGPAGPSEAPTSKFYEANITTHALYIQDEWTLTDQWLLTLGARQTWVDAELENTDDPISRKGSVTDGHPVFSAGLVWNGLRDTALRAQFSQGYRFPDLNKLFIGTQHGGPPTLPNTSLNPETSNNYEIGARFDNGIWLADITGFVSCSEDYITNITTNGVQRFENVDEAETRGVEALLSYTVQGEIFFTPYISGTWMKRKYEDKNSSTWDTNTPELSGRVGLRCEKEMPSFPGMVWADLWLRGATDATYWETFVPQARPGQPATPVKVKQTNESWQTLNLAFGAEFGKKRQYRVSVNLNNLFDQSYHTAQNNLDAAGFHAVINMGFHF